jgi:phosphate transport system permease protein
MSKTQSIRDAVAARLPRRHRAEQRFQAYGLAAIVLAVVFLAVLIGSILIQSIPAFTAHRMSLPVTLEATLVDPRGDGSEASLRRGSYNAAIQASLREQFPDVDGRAQLRELFGLYSAVNAARLLNDVVANPSVVGRTVEFEFPISDDADLYLKGRSVEERFVAGSGPISIAIDGDGMSLSAQTPVFAAFANALRADVAERAAAADARAARALAQAGETIDPDERQVLQAEAERAAALAERLRTQLTPDTPLRLGAQDPSLMVRVGEGVIRLTSIAADGASAEGEVLLPAAGLLDGRVEAWTLWEIETPAAARLITDRQIVFARTLEERGRVRNAFNSLLFTSADSREPELAGVLGALIGSILTMIITMFMAVPIGVGAAIYLEEFAPKNRFTAFIEVNINNLAAVPSIVFGLLGLAVFINSFGLPRSAPLVGGMVLALMTLPTVIISSRAALKAVPPSIREAALGVGASKTQAVFHHVLPLALPGMLTGSIIGLAQALGETAPLLMIGMVAFIADAPSFGFSGFTEPATVMPVQIFIWSSSAERAFEARTAAAILILLTMMISFNAVAIYLRRRFERRW